MTDGSVILIGLLFLVAIALAFWVGRLTASRSRGHAIPEFSPDSGPLAAPQEPAAPRPSAPSRRVAPPPANAGPGSENGAPASTRTSAPRGKPPPAAAG
jgi:hypothetical protein